MQDDEHASFFKKNYKLVNKSEKRKESVRLQVVPLRNCPCGQERQ